MSWGTKGDNKVSTDLGVVKTTAGKTNEVEVSVPTEDRDINAAYEDAIHVLSTKPPKVESKPDPATQQEDYYRQFRTKCVVFCHFFSFTRGGDCRVWTDCWHTVSCWHGHCQTFVVAVSLTRPGY